MMNASLAYRALSVLQVETGIGKAEIISAMEHTRWMGRMQQAEPFIYFDGAHNAAVSYTHLDIVFLHITVMNAEKW